MANYIFEANSFNEYLDFIKNYSKGKKQEIWFRGQQNNNWGLKPNLYRDAIIDRRPNEEIIRLRYNFVDFNEEFSRLKEEIIEKSLFNISELNNFNIMFIAQHYGLLTPILDWTLDPLIALFFAIDEYVYEQDTWPVVHIFKPCLCNENSFLLHRHGESISSPLCIDSMSDELFEFLIQDLNNSIGHIPIAIFTEKLFSHRISKQSGKFTFHNAVGPLNYAWNDTIINTIPTEPTERFVDTIKIHPKMIEEAKEYLMILNITKESVYLENSELDKVCKQLKETSLDMFKETIREINKSFTLQN